MSAVRHNSAVPSDGITALADHPRSPKPAVISAWAIAVLVAGDFAMLVVVAIAFAIRYHRTQRRRGL
ncbi:hypothetical protein [Cellulomonas sp. URHD0024]|uniref:hypothetical protein n=1 Tax=Cellulomonas sp. URHD0024 TaxID=1302620 RepID=UPI000411376A|nr:hypothetical protein [Cellulomonas sp. URHD0024]